MSSRFNFDSTGIVSGYIKQLLAAANIPKYNVYLQEHAEYFQKYGKERYDIIESSLDGVPVHVPYIKDGKLQEFINGIWRPVGTINNDTPDHFHYYDPDSFILNKTRKFLIRNNVYDSYTHKYLGDYLRYKRDLEGINLMPLYNCFCNELCTDLSLTININSKTKTVFSSSDPLYKVYKVPIKLFQQYTVAIDSDFPVEIVSAVHGRTLEKSSLFEMLHKQTYAGYSAMHFSRPELYDPFKIFRQLDKVTSSEEAYYKTIIQRVAIREADLCMLIKVPISCESTITILEGNYTHWNNKTFSITGNGGASSLITKTNHTIISDDLVSSEQSNLSLVTNLQLLRLNTKKTYPFADRLLEYLFGNCLTSELTNSPDSISYLQQVAQARGSRGDFKYRPMFKGVWDEQLRLLLYRFQVNTGDSIFNTNHDHLGYLDKDTEIAYSAVTNDTAQISMLNIETLDGD